MVHSVAVSYHFDSLVKHLVQVVDLGGILDHIPELLCRTVGIDRGRPEHFDSDRGVHRHIDIGRG